MELLAVIAILAILVILALPNVINLYNKAQKETFLTEVKKIHSEAEKKYISSSINGNTIKTINSEDDSKLDMTGEKLQYCINLNNSGKVTSMKVSNHKWIVSLEDGESVEDLTIDDLEDGNLDGYKCTGTSSVPAVYCTYDGELKQGAEYVNGQYTYRYMQEYTLNYSSSSNDDLLILNNIDSGWSVTLTDKSSTEPVTSKVCTYINNKPVVSMSFMFVGSQSSSIDLSGLNTLNIVNMQGMFFSTQVEKLDLSSFDTSSVTDMSGMFAVSNAKSIIGLSNFNTSKVTNMMYMFLLSQAESINLSFFNTSSVTDMSYMFSQSQASTIDISNFKTSKVTYMNEMFSKSNAKEIKGLKSFNTSNVINMDNMFYDTWVTELDLSSFDTSKVTNMRQMFMNSQMETLDLSSFDTKNVTNMDNMFSGSKFKTIYVSNKFVTDNVTKGSNMFTRTSTLVGGNGTKYNSSYTDKTYARIDTASTPGYFTAK